MEEILLTDLTTKDVLHLPFLPQEVNAEYGQLMETHNVIKLGEVGRTNGTKLTTISWEGIVLDASMAKLGVGEYEYYLDQFEMDSWFRTMLEEDRIVRVMFTGSNINLDCHLTSYSSKQSKGPILFTYSVSFTEHREVSLQLEDATDIMSNNCFYNLKVKDHGWGHECVMGEITGTSGQCLATEEFTMRVTLDGVKAEYQVHVSNDGWIPLTEDNHPAGRAPEKLEAIKIRLTGPNSGLYDVWYRVHVQDRWWMEWHKNWEEAGTTGLNLRLEAIQILVIPKGSFYKYDRYLPIAYDFINYPMDCMNREGWPGVNGGHVYQIIDNDTLWNIAADFYQDGTRWKEIYEANRNVLSDPLNLITGTAIFIP